MTRRHGNLSAEQCPAGLAPTELLLTSASAASSCRGCAQLPMRAGVKAATEVGGVGGG